MNAPRVTRWIGNRPAHGETADLRTDGAEIRVNWAAIMRRIRWAAKRADLAVPRHIKIRPYRRKRDADCVSGAGWCVRRKGGTFEIGVRVDAPWIVQVEEVLVHEVAHAVAWRTNVPSSHGHTVTCSAAYGAIYAAYYDLDETEGPPRPGFAIKRCK